MFYCAMFGRAEHCEKKCVSLEDVMMKMKMFLVMLLVAAMGSSSFAATIFMQANGEFGTAGNWNAGLPGAGVGDIGIVQNGRIANNTATYAGANTYDVWLRGAGATLNVSADLGNIGLLDTQTGITGGTIVNQTAGAVTVVNAVVGGDEGLTSAYNLIGGTLAPTGGVTIGASGALNLSGGAFSIGGNNTATATGVNIQTGGLLDISGGAHYLGSRMALNGTFRVTGDGATIDMHQMTNSSGDMEFVLNATGISSIDIDSWHNLNVLGLVVDGSAYTGGAADFDLVTGNAVSLFSDITVTGLGAEGVGYTITQTMNSGVVLNIIPEPATMALLSLGGLFLRRRKR